MRRPPNTAKLEAFGEFEDGSALRQRREGCVPSHLGRIGRKDARYAGSRNLATDDSFAGIGLKAEDPRRLVWQPFPDRQQQACHDMDRAFRDPCELRQPGGGKAFAVGFEPMALRHHLQWDAMLLHRPDQPDALFDLAVIKHEAGGRDLHSGPARALVNQQDGAMI